MYLLLDLITIKYFKMSSYTPDFIKIISKGEFKFYKAETIIENNLYKIIWHRDILQDDTILNISLDYKFDMQSFLAYCKENSFSEINERITINGIGMHFPEIAPLALKFGKENYLELANYLNKYWGSIHSGKFGI